MLNSALKPSNAITTETLLVGLEPKYNITLVGLDVSATTDFKDTVLKLRKAKTRLKN
jgi:hypothetical protein